MFDPTSSGFGGWWLMLIVNIINLAFVLAVWSATGWLIAAFAAIVGGGLIAALLWLRIRYGDEYRRH